MEATRIHTFTPYVRMMYAYSTPEIARHNGWLKIGGTMQRRYFEGFVSHDYQQTGFHHSYKLRKEQQKAVDMTQTYLKEHNMAGQTCYRFVSDSESLQSRRGWIPVSYLSVTCLCNI